jgi:hypothetical protein
MVGTPLEMGFTSKEVKRKNIYLLKENSIHDEICTSWRKGAESFGVFP